MEELNCETAFTIPVFGGIPVAESVVVTWIIMAVLLLGSIILVRNLKVENVGKKQVVLETVVGGLYNFFYDLLGEDGKGYIPYLMTVGLYIGVANMIGLFGLKSPTKDVGVTGALALMSIVLIEFSGVHKKGVKGFLKSFAEQKRFVYVMTDESRSRCEALKPTVLSLMALHANASKSICT